MAHSNIIKYGTYIYVDPKAEAARKEMEEAALNASVQVSDKPNAPQAPSDTFWSKDQGDRLEISSEDYANFLRNNQVEVHSTQDNIADLFSNYEN